MTLVKFCVKVGNLNCSSDYIGYSALFMYPFISCLCIHHNDDDVRRDDDDDDDDDEMMMMMMMMMMMDIDNGDEG